MVCFSDVKCDVIIWRYNESPKILEKSSIPCDDENTNYKKSFKKASLMWLI